MGMLAKFLNSVWQDESGASAAEYALILAIVGTGLALGAFQLGTAVSGAMDEATTCVSQVGGNISPSC